MSLFPLFRPWTRSRAAGELLQGSRQAVPQSISSEVRRAPIRYMGWAEILLSMVECWSSWEGISENSCPGSVPARALFWLLCWSLELSECIKTSLQLQGKCCFHWITSAWNQRVHWIRLEPNQKRGGKKTKQLISALFPSGHLIQTYPFYSLLRTEMRH